ncbi:MAG TPA: OmpA family protein [Candidatus Eisenbacteria bacterium]|nr:OmpA family protein [Candidatus Eisenbacteria bacterium]
MRSRWWGGVVRGALTLMTGTALLTGCGVSKAKYLDMTKSRDELSAKNTELQSSLEQANKDKAQLEADKAALDVQVKEAQAVAAEKAKAADEMKGTYESMIGNLKEELSSGKIEIERVRDGISVNMAQDILFKSGSAELDKTGRELLVQVAENVKANPYQIVVTGHTDNQKIGASLAKKYPTNWELGGARAAQIVRVFEQTGIAKERLSAVSFADSRPRQGNDTPEGRDKNRRIEIKLVPPLNQQTAEGSTN